MILRVCSKLNVLQIKARKKCCRCLFMLISDHLHSTGCNDVPRGNQQYCVAVHSCTFFKHYLWCWVVSKKDRSLFVLSLSFSLSSLKSVAAAAAAAAAAAGLGCLVGKLVLFADNQVTYTVRGPTGCTVAGTR